MDRYFALPANKKDASAGKRMAIAMSYGDTDAFNSGCVNGLRTFQDDFRYVGADIVGMVYGSAEKPGEIKSAADGSRLRRLVKNKPGSK